MHTHTRISRGFVRDVHFPVCRYIGLENYHRKSGAAASAAMSAASVDGAGAHGQVNVPTVSPHQTIILQCGFGSVCGCVRECVSVCASVNFVQQFTFVWTMEVHN